MTINDFLRKTLHLQLSNPTWSWDATDKTTNTVVMKLWQDCHIKKAPERIEVFSPHYDEESHPHGRNERRGHVARLVAGGETYAVIREGGGERGAHLRTYEPMLYRLGKVVTDKKKKQYALIVEKLTPNEFLNRSSAVEADIADIKARHPAKSTSRQALVDARIGQGVYKKELLALWGNRCAVTGCHLLEVVRASHAKPWRLSNDDERLDPNNGLPLIATIDILFDRGLIGFADDGSMILSSYLHPDYRPLLGLPAGLSQKPTPEQASFLLAHRQSIFQGRPVA